MSLSRTRRLIAGGLGAAAMSLGATASASAALPVNYNLLANFTSGSLSSPSKSPLGANDWSCVPSAAHPVPVVLVHATFTNMALNWNALSPLLKNKGYCVYAFNYGQTSSSFGGYVNGLGPIEASGLQLSAFVDKVIAATGKPKVDVVGHSQGGLLTRYFINVLGGDAKVDKSVALAPTTHGTTLLGLVTLGANLKKAIPFLAAPIVNALNSNPAAALQQQSTSTFMQALNKTPETMPGVSYTIISTKYDEVNTPWQSQQLNSPSAKNIVLQNQCGLDFTDHIAMAFDSIALRDVLNALDPAHAVKPTCKFITPLVGG